MKKVVLYGELGRKFGKYWYLDVKTPAEAFRAIAANKPEFAQYLEENKDTWVKIFCGKETTTNPKQLTFPVSNKEVIRIVPVVQGGGGLGMVILGAILIVISVVFPWTAPVLGPLGWGLVVGGVATIIAQSMAKKPTDPTNDSPENRPSFVFTGVVNTSAQGGCVPVCYGGPIEVGSYVVSASIDTRDYPLDV